MTDLIEPQPAPPAVWRRALTTAGLVYLFSRVCVAVGAAIVAAGLRADENLRVEKFPWARWASPYYAGTPIPKNALRPMIDVLTGWDGVWYLRIVKHGYPAIVQAKVTYDVPDARAAFFPTYPILVKAFDTILPGGADLASLFVNFVLGALVVWLVGLLARSLFDVQVAQRAMILTALFPGSFVLSFAYTEALLLVLAAATFLLLMRHQWWTAGLVAALGTATRPNGVALVAACAVAAWIAIRTNREWRALAAPAIAPLGFLGFQLWLGRHTHETMVWFRVQSEAWGEGTSFGSTALRRTWQAFIRPMTSPTNTITAVSVLTLVVLFWMLRRYRLPLMMTAYSIVVVALMLLPETVTARPRFIFTAFPLLIPAAAWFEREKPHWWPWLLSCCAVGLVTLTALYGVNAAVP